MLLCVDTDATHVRSDLLNEQVRTVLPEFYEEDATARAATTSDRRARMHQLDEEAYKREVVRLTSEGYVDAHARVPRPRQRRHQDVA